MSVKAAQSGFTIVELMLTILVLSTLVVVGVPQFREVQANAALRGAAMDLVSALNIARAEAVSLRTTVTVSPNSGTDWSSGWALAFAAGQTDQNRAFAGRADVTVTEAGGLSSITFSDSGTVSGAAEFEVCDARTGETGRRIRVNQLGRITNDEITCP